MTGASRVFRDKRAWVVSLLTIAVVNALVYALGVAPLRARVANGERAAASAQADVKAANEQFEQAQKILSGKSRAGEQLRRFYEEVLPVDLPAARRVTHLDLAQLARDANLRVLRRDQGQAQEKDSALVHLDSSIEIEGSYRDVRAFLYEVETTPDFVVINSVSLAHRDKESDGLALSMSVSTYFRPARGQ